MQRIARPDERAHAAATGLDAQLISMGQAFLAQVQASVCLKDTQDWIGPAAQDMSAFTQPSAAFSKTCSTSQAGFT